MTLDDAMASQAQAQAFANENVVALSRELLTFQREGVAPVGGPLAALRALCSRHAGDSSLAVAKALIADAAMSFVDRHG